MKSLIINIMIFALVLFFSSVLLAQSQENLEKYSKVKITIQDKSDLDELQIAGLSLEGMKLDENSVELILSEREIIKLDDLGFSHQILIEDMTKYYQERSRRTETELKSLERKMKDKYSNGGFGFGSMGGFYTYDEIVEELDSMSMLYPNIITEKYSIGTTLEGRTIWAVKISDNPGINENEPELFYNALVHGREPAGMMSLIYFMYYLLENYSTDPEITYLVDNREFYFVPTINPDGYIQNQQTYPNGGGMWRKNRRDVGGTIYGVDIPRNYEYMWGYNNIGSSPIPQDETYRGTAPFSEPETQAVRDFCLAHNFIIAHNFHCYGDAVISPWGYQLEQTSDSVFFNNIVQLATCINNYDNFWYATNGLYYYERNGDHLDWQYGEQIAKPKIFALATEVGNNNDGFWPIPERIFPLAEENVYLNKVLAWGPGVIDNPPHIFESSVYPSYSVPSEDSITITATESNPDNFNSTVTAYLYDSEENLIEEFEMSKIDTNTYYNTRLVSQEEKFYHLLLKDSGVQIPSNFYSSNNKLKFTTAGPVIVDSMFSAYIPAQKRYSFKLYLKNLGSTLQIKSPTVKVFCNDPWVTNISGITETAPSILPGQVVSCFGITSIFYDSTSFPGYFNLKFEISSGGYFYWIDSVKKIITGIANESNEVPTEYFLSQNYSNPFNPTTTIGYGIKEKSNVKIIILNAIGEEVAVVLNEEKESGYHQIEFNASNLPSGVYFYQLRAGEFISVKKMILLK